MNTIPQSGQRNSDAPFFSIITPTFKRPGLLKRNIKSIAEQSYSNWEHIIVDDANDDETAKLVKEIADERIIFLRHDASKGAAASYNTGIRSSKGKLLLFLDDDDEYLPGFLEKMHKTFLTADAGTGFIWSGITRIRDTFSGEIPLLSLVWPSVFPGKEEGLIAATSIGNGFGVCVRKKCIDDIGLFDETLKVGSDTDFMFRLATKYNFRTIPEALVRIHYHGKEQLTGSQNNSERIKVKEIILKRYYDFLKLYSGLYSVHYSAYADLCYKSGLRSKGRKAYFSIIKNCRFKLITYTDFFFSELTGSKTKDTYLGKKLNRILNFMKGINVEF